MWQGEQEIGLAQIQKSLTILQRLEDEEMMPFLLMGNAVAFINMGRDGAAEAMLKEALVLFEEQDQPYFHIATLVHLGNVELGLGNPEQALALHEEALMEARALGENWAISFALNNLGEVARTQGQYDLARKYYEECEALLRDTGDLGDLARFVHSLGYIAQHEGDYARAEAQFKQSLTMFRRIGQSARHGGMYGRAGGSESSAGKCGMGCHHAERGGVGVKGHRRRLVACGPR